MYLYKHLHIDIYICILKYKYIYICIFKCIHVYEYKLYVCVCLNIYIFVYLHACMYACIYVFKHACLHACMHIYIYTNTRYWLIYRLYLLLYVQSSFCMVPSSFLSIKFIQPSMIFSDRFWYILFITCRASKWSPQILIPETPPENLRIFSCSHHRSPSNPPVVKSPWFRSAPTSPLGPGMTSGCRWICCWYEAIYWDWWFLWFNPCKFHQEKFRSNWNLYLWVKFARIKAIKMIDLKKQTRVGDSRWRFNQWMFHGLMLFFSGTSFNRMELQLQTRYG